MPRPVCVSCQLEFRCEKNSVAAVLLSGSPPAPYQIWDCDMWKCPGCGMKILSGYGRQPLAENWQDKFRAELAHAEVKVEVFERVP
jgi:hypothetical protein